MADPKWKGLIVWIGATNGHHPVLCVTTRLFKEEVLRGYYRQRLFL
jgi:hypothetical protein